VDDVRKCDPREFAVPRPRARVLVVGIGGLGSPALVRLAKSGVGAIGVADGDAVDLSNLARQIVHTTAGIGRPKTVSAEEFLRSAGFAGSVERIPTRLDVRDILDAVSAWDVVVDGCDTFRSKFMLNDACVLAGKPLVHAGVLRFEGQLMTILPKRTACLRCLLESPPPPGAAPRCSEAGVLGAVPGVLGTIQADEALRVLDGGGGMSGRVLTFDARRVRFRVVPVLRDPACPVCGDRPRIDRIAGEHYPAEEYT